MDEGQTAWLLAWQQCWHIVGQSGARTDIKGGWGHLSGCLSLGKERVGVWQRHERFYFGVGKNFLLISSGQYEQN